MNDMNSLKEGVCLTKQIKRYRMGVFFLSAISLLNSTCSSKKENFLFEKQENWGEWHAGDTITIHYKLTAYKRGKDTIYYTKNFYPNGTEKTKTIHINDRLFKIHFVNDTTGRPVDFGNLENGTGHVKKYDFRGTLEYSGDYINGNKEGWWYFYHFSGEVLDSTLFRDGFDVNSNDSTLIDYLFGLPGRYRNNLYN